MRAHKSVAKTGGTSGATAGAILKSEWMIRRYGITALVVSAAGSRFKGDKKVTDLLLELGDKDLREGNLAEIKARHLQIVRGLGLSRSAKEAIGIEHQRLAALAAQLDDGHVRIDDVGCFGEDIMARIRAARLGWIYRSAKGLIKLDMHGNLDLDACAKAFAENPLERYSVLGGFFGSLQNGRTQLMQRGCSDTSGAAVARFGGAKRYVIATDVDGIHSTDPNMIGTTVRQPSLLHSEARCLADGGAQVVNVDALYPLIGTGISVQVICSWNPNEPGTTLVEHSADLKRNLNYVVGISGYERCMYIRIRKSGANRSIGFTQQLSSIFAQHQVNVSHWADDVDVLGPVIRQGDLAGKDTAALFADIQDTLHPEAFEVHENESLLRVVFDKRAPRTKTIVDVLATLSQEDVDFRSLTSTEQCMNLVIGQADYYKAVGAVHDLFFCPEKVVLNRVRLENMRMERQSRPA